MTDFQEMARQAKEAAEAADAKRLAAKADAARLEAERMDRAKAFITERVSPQLAQAKAAFESEGIGCGLDEGSSYSHATGAGVLQTYFASIRCFDPIDESKPAYARHAGGTVKFEHDGSRLSAKASWEGQYGGSIQGTDDHLVEKGIKIALERYLARLDV